MLRSVVCYLVINREVQREIVSRAAFSFHNGLILFHSFFLPFLVCSGLSNQYPCCCVVVWVLHAAAAQPTHRPSGRRTDKWCGCVQRDRVLVSPGSPVPWRHSRILKRTSLGEKVVACAEAAPSSQHPSKLTFLFRELFHGCRTDKITYLQATCST